MYTHTKTSYYITVRTRAPVASVVAAPPTTHSSWGAVRTPHCTQILHRYDHLSRCPPQAFGLQGHLSPTQLHGTASAWSCHHKGQRWCRVCLELNRSGQVQRASPHSHRRKPTLTSQAQPGGSALPRVFKAEVATPRLRSDPAVVSYTANPQPCLPARARTGLHAPQLPNWPMQGAARRPRAV